MKKVLITGGHGYIGHNLKVFLRSKGYHVDVCDKDWGAENLDELYEYSDGGVVHLAALSGIIACKNDPYRAIHDNILTAQNVFGLTNTDSIPVVFTSSQAAKTPASSIYAFIKKVIEELAYEYAYENSFVLRLTNVYGGEYYLEKKNTVVKKFINQYRNNNPLMIQGNGDQERDFIHVDDVCRAIYKCLVYWDENNDNITTPIDIGTGIGTSIAELATMFPEDGFSKFVESREVGEQSSIADTKNAEEILYFKAENRLKQYIAEMTSCKK